MRIRMLLLLFLWRWAGYECSRGSPSLPRKLCFVHSIFLLLLIYQGFFLSFSFKLHMHSLSLCYSRLLQQSTSQRQVWQPHTWLTATTYYLSPRERNNKNASRRTLQKTARGTKQKAKKRIPNIFPCLWIQTRNPLPLLSSQRHLFASLLLQERTRVLSLSFSLSLPSAFCKAPTVQRIPPTPRPPTLHTPPPSLPPPSTPFPPGGIDGLLLTVHSAACSCSDRGQPNVGRKQEESRGWAKRVMTVPGVL